MSGQQFDASKQKLEETIAKVSAALARPNWGGSIESFDFSTENFYEIWSLLKESQMKDEEIRRLESANFKLADNNRFLTHNALKALKTRDDKIRDLTDVLKSNDHYKKNLELRAEIKALKSKKVEKELFDELARQAVSQYHLDDSFEQRRDEYFLTSTPDEEFKGFKNQEELDDDFKQWREKEIEKLAEQTLEQFKDMEMEDSEDSDGWKVLDFSDVDEKEVEGMEK